MLEYSHRLLHLHLRSKRPTKYEKQTPPLALLAYTTYNKYKIHSRSEMKNNVAEMTTLNWLLYGEKIRSSRATTTTTTPTTTTAPHVPFKIQFFLFLLPNRNSFFATREPTKAAQGSIVERSRRPGTFRR